MKHILTILLLSITILSFGQTTMNIYQNNGTTVNLPISTIDSVNFTTTPPPPTMNIYQMSGGIISIVIADIDSITYTVQGTSGLAVLSTSSVTNINSNSAVSGGNVISDGGSPVTQSGVVYSSSPNPSFADYATYDGTGTGSFISSLNGLIDNTTYYVRAYATNANGTAFGNEVSFTTLNSTSIPAISTNPITNLDSTSAVSGGYGGGVNITNRGVCYSINSNPTTANNITNDGNGSGYFSSTLTGLTPNTTYYVRAYATNSAGTAYGNEVSFTTATSTPAIGDSYQGGILFYLDGLGGGLIAAPNNQSSGAHWGCNFVNSFFGNTAIATAIGSGAQNTANINSSCSGLSFLSSAAYLCGTLNSGGYNDWFLPSKDELNLMYQNIGPGNALGLGNVGGFAGVDYWSSSQIPQDQSDWAWEQNFTSGYQDGTAKLYELYVRAIRAFQGTSGLAVLNTSSVTNITGTSAVLGGVVVNDGGSAITPSPVTERGVVWSTTPNPTTANNSTIDGSGTGSFSSNLTGLTPNTTYYVRAYATNINGTAYGNELNFTTATPLAIGDSYQGGIIFHLFGSGFTGGGGGLIAAPTDQSSSAEWGCFPFSGANDIAIGTGAQNTIDIEAGCSTSGIAADICANLVLSSYTDWFLPSRDELNLMYQNIGPGNALGLGNVGGFTNNPYWSSTNFSYNYAWGFDFLNGDTYVYNKGDTYYVRAIRAF